MATLQEIIDQVQDVTGALAGVRLAPDEPPDQVSVWPVIIAFAQSGEWRGGDPPQFMTGVHDIVVRMHVPRTDMARNITTLMGYAKSVPNAIFKAWLVSGSMTAMSYMKGSIRYRLRDDLDYGETPTLCLEWTISGAHTQDQIA